MTTEIQTEEISKEIAVVETDATALIVVDNATYLQAGEKLKAFKGLEKKIKTYFEPLKKSAHAAWKQICDRENEELTKLQPGLQHLSKQMTAYNIAQEKIRQEEEKRLQAEAKAREEEERLRAAIEAEASGASKEETTAILETPVFTPPPIVEKTVPKQAGLAMASIWKHRTTNLLLLCKAVADGKAPITCIQANDTFLGQQARAGKGVIQYPGVEFYSDKGMRGVRT